MIEQRTYSARSLGKNWSKVNAYNQTVRTISSVQPLSCVRLFATPWTAAHQPPLSSTSLGVCSNWCPLNQWCYLTISSSAAPFSFCLQFLLASGSFPMSWLFATGGLSIRASVSILSMNIQGWFPLGLIGLISLQSKGLSTVFSSWVAQYTVSKDTPGSQQAQEKMSTMSISSLRWQS